MKNFQNIFFDLDGTLTDPKEGIINSYLFALNKLGLNENDPITITNYFGAPLHEYFSVRHNLSSAEIDTAIEYYRQYYSVKGLYENYLYDGIENLLSGLYNKDKILYLVSVKPTKFVKDILVHFKIDRYFKDIYGSDLTNHNKSKEELINSLLINENLNKDTCVMVGDRVYDISGAKYNRINSIAVTYGYGSVEELISSSPDYIIDTIDELTLLL